MGVVLHRLGDDEGAIREWTRSSRDAPEDMRPRAYLASVGVTFPGGERHDATTPGGPD
jgi:hypothetical protein